MLQLLIAAFELAQNLRIRYVAGRFFERPDHPFLQGGPKPGCFIKHPAIIFRHSVPVSVEQINLLRLLAMMLLHKCNYAGARNGQGTEILAVNNSSLWEPRNFSGYMICGYSEVMEAHGLKAHPYQWLHLCKTVPAHFL